MPEIRTRPVEDLVLQLKSMFIDNVANFPFPTPPDAVQIKTAERKLMLLGKKIHNLTFNSYVVLTQNALRTHFGVWRYYACMNIQKFLFDNVALIILRSMGKLQDSTAVSVGFLSVRKFII